MGSIRQLLLAALIVVLAGASCSIETPMEEAAESPPPPKRQIIAPLADDSAPEVLGIVTTPDVASSDAKRVEDLRPDPTPEPAPTLTAYRVAVHSSGDWIIDGDEVVTVHGGPNGDPVGVVAVGVIVRSTGTARVLADATWLEIELPDGQRGYVRSSDLRIGQSARTEPEADGESMLVPQPTVEAAAVDPSATTTATPAPLPPATAVPAAVAPTATTSTEMFLFSGWDTERRTYEVAARTSQIWVQLGDELVRATSVSIGHRLEVLSQEGRIVNDLPLVQVRSRGFEGWIDVRDLRLAE